MSLKKRAGKALAMLLTASLVCGTNLPISALASENVVADVSEVVSENSAVAEEVNAEPETVSVEAQAESGNTGIFVDSENATIDLRGNSVVISAVDGSTTAIYADADGNGEADSATPLHSGNLSTYTVYGIKDTDTDKSICITINGGTIDKMYGAYNANITAEGHGLKMFLNGGTVTNGIEVLSNATVTNMVKVVETKDVSVTDTTAQTATGGYYRGHDNGIVWIYGVYALDEVIDVTSLYVQTNSKFTISANANIKTKFQTYANSVVTIENGVTVTVKANKDKVWLRDNSTLILKGTLDNWTFYKQSGGSGVILVQGGTPKNTNYDYIYYPINVTKNLEKATPSFTNSRTFTENGVKTTYLLSDERSSATIAVPGYDCYYSLNGAEAIKSDGTALSISVSKAATSLQLNYVPKQISVNKYKADPVAVVSKQYTAENPLYDLSTLEITDDTTSVYGGEVSYSLKEGTQLPKGLSLSGSKIVGTPSVVNMIGTKVTFEVTGRNGTKANVDFTMKVAEEGYTPKDINDLVLVDGKTIDLQGTSVVILPVGNTVYSQIYLDEDHDKTADNDIPLLINGSDKCELRNYYTIYGYRATDVPYEGDISISVKGGYLYEIYGVKGDYKNTPAVVNGDVTVSVDGACMRESSSTIIGALNARVNNLVYSVTSGTYRYTDFYGVYDSTVNGDVCYTVGGKLRHEGPSGGYNSDTKVEFSSVYNSVIKGNVKQKIGLESSNYAITYPEYCSFYGVRASEVEGSVNCITDGYWNTNKMTMVSEQSTVGGDVTLEHITGEWDAYLSASVVDNSTVTGDVKMVAKEGAVLPKTTVYFLSTSNAENVYIKIPDSCTEYINLYPCYGAESQIHNSTYVYKQGALTVSGEYTIEEDVNAASVTIEEDADVTIAENKTLDVDGSFVVGAGATLVNKGALDLNITSGNSPQSSVAGCLDNYGTLVTGGSNNTNCYLSIGSTAKIINRNNASWNIKNYIENTGKIVNYGSFVQECTDMNYDYKLGAVYSTKPLVLNRSPKDATLYYSNSTFYYGVTVDCPDYYTEGVTVAGDAVVSSGIAGDTNKYVKVVASGAVSPTFTVTPAGNVSENITVESVTYGVGNETLGTLQVSNGVWSGVAAGVLEPFVVSFHYETVDETPFITLTEDTVRIENSEEETKLIVGRSYTESVPLYDLNTLQIENEEAAGGIISCTLDRSSSLPDGLVFENGKVYGTFSAAKNEEQEIRFVIKAGNDTCALFTLVLGSVKKAETSLVLPVTVETECGKTLEEIALPEVDSGTYQWQTQTEEIIKADRTCTAVFIPNDADNYDWSTIEGWNEAEERVEFSVAIKVAHKNWNAGVITKAPTTTATGVKTYTCVCGATKTETIPKLSQGSTGNNGSGENTGSAGDNAGNVNTEGTSESTPDDTDYEEEDDLPEEGTEFTDSVSKANYEIFVEGEEVIFVKPDKKTYTKITIPNTVTYEGVTYKVTEIADNACKGNSKLKTVVIGSNVNTIGTRAFYGCKKLTKVTIGSSVEEIGDSAFQSCIALKKVTIPVSVTDIGSKAFYGCKKLMNMTIKTTELTNDSVGKSAFKKMGSSNYKKVTIKVPKKKLSAYKKMLKKRGLSSRAKVKK